VKLQQRPEADDVAAMQQQMSSLHLVMEQTSSEHEREVERVQADLRAVEGERERLRAELEAARKDVQELPGADDVSKYAVDKLLVVCVCQETSFHCQLWFVDYRSCINQMCMHGVLSFQT
jgi:flagellar motility protein MotE (MotC chaperone)